MRETCSLPKFPQTQSPIRKDSGSCVFSTRNLSRKLSLCKMTRFTKAKLSLLRNMIRKPAKQKKPPSIIFMWKTFQKNGTRTNSKTYFPPLGKYSTWKSRKITRKRAKDSDLFASQTVKKLRLRLKNWMVQNKESVSSKLENSKKRAKELANWKWR